jgi:hypothetical protein
MSNKTTRDRRLRMRLAKFIASILLLAAVLYFGLTSTTGVLACSGGLQSGGGTGFDCECYFPNTNDYGIICGSGCIRMDCDLEENIAGMRIAK